MDRRKDLSKKERKELIEIYKDDKEAQLDAGVNLSGLVEENSDTDKLIDKLNSVNEESFVNSELEENHNTPKQETKIHTQPTLPPGTKSFAEILNKAEKIKVDKEDAETQKFYDEIHKSFDILKNGALSDHLSQQQYMTVLEFVEVYEKALDDVKEIMKPKYENVKMDHKLNKLFSYMKRKKMKKRDLFQSRISPVPNAFLDLKVDSIGDIDFTPMSIRTFLTILSLGVSWISFMIGAVIVGLISGVLFTLLFSSQIRKSIFSFRVHKATQKMRKLKEVIEYDSKFALSMIRVGKKTVIDEISIDDLLKKFDEIKSKSGEIHEEE